APGPMCPEDPRSVGAAGGLGEQPRGHPRSAGPDPEHRCGAPARGGPEPGAAHPVRGAAHQGPSGPSRSARPPPPRTAPAGARARRDVVPTFEAKYAESRTSTPRTAEVGLAATEGTYPTIPHIP